MKVFVFDLLAYDANLDHLKGGETELPYPLAKRHFDAETAVRTYEEHLDAWEALDRFGYDGVGFNEHHCSPYGLMNSPNLMASAAAQRTKRLKLLIYGNLLPLHEPLRLAEELAMIDCMSNGRLISGFARGIPREYQVHNVQLADSRARFEEAYDIITRAWTEEVFSYEGRFWSYKDVAMWPRPVQQPHPPIWVPVIGSKESIEFAARHNLPITPGLGRHQGLRDDIIRFYAKSLAASGHRITPDHLSLGITAYVADSKAQAVKEYGPHILYFNRTLFSHGNFTETEKQRETGYARRRLDRLRAAGEPAGGGEFARGFPPHDDGRPRTPGRDDADGHRRRGRRAHHRRRRQRRRQPGAIGAEPRRPAARILHGPDRTLRPRSPAPPAGARSENRSRRGGNGDLERNPVRFERSRR